LKRTTTKTKTKKTKTPVVHTHESHTCTFCHGRGIDPFDAMSDRSVCGSCSGKGTVMVPTPHVPCAFCSGTGAHKTYRCLVCRGSGVIAAPVGPTQACPDCEGKAFEASSGMACLTCKGHGFVTEVPK
jgi:DnaJ-class molecular chaperone